MNNLAYNLPKNDDKVKELLYYRSKISFDEKLNMTSELAVPWLGEDPFKFDENADLIDGMTILKIEEDFKKGSGMFKEPKEESKIKKPLSKSLPVKYQSPSSSDSDSNSDSEKPSPKKSKPKSLKKNNTKKESENEDDSSSSESEEVEEVKSKAKSKKKK